MLHDRFDQAASTRLSLVDISTAGDDAARVFAAQFYSAIGFGKSVAVTFCQARAALMLEGISEEDIPEPHGSDGLDLENLVLVRPSANLPSPPIS